MEGIAPKDGGCMRWAQWLLTPEGAVVCEPERTGVVADLHLGYEWARARGGDMVPAHSLAETCAKLATLLARGAINRLIVAGDLVESAAPCARTAADVAQLRAWLNERGVQLEVVAGNHDPDGPETLIVAACTIGHGHRPIPGPRRILGHYHPVMHIGGARLPCFLVSADTIVLPPFSANAAGLDVATARLPGALAKTPLRCVVSTGTDLLDFGSPRPFNIGGW